MDDASLEDFLDTADDDPQEGDSDAPEGISEGETPDGNADARGELPGSGADRAAGTDADGDRRGPVRDLDRVEPATPTSVFDPDGADCERCGVAVERRWQSPDGLVCVDCTDWS